MKRWYEPKKDTPGIDKNAPKKKGFSLFLEILWREFFPLLKLNLFFLLTCIPIITIPASLTAMSRITTAMVRDKNYFMWADYWEAFKRDFGRSLAGGIVVALGLALFGLATWFYYMLTQLNLFFLILAGASACLLLTAWFVGMYFFPMLATVELPTRKLLLNSVILAYTNFKRTFPAALITLGLLLLGVGLLPFSFIFDVCVLFSLMNLIGSFFVLKPIEVTILGMGEPAPAAQTDVADHTTKAGEIQSADIGEFPEWEDEEGDH